jgi:hypothetical protein
MSMRSGASVSQLRALNCVPRGARTGPRPASSRRWSFIGALYHPAAGVGRCPEFPMIRWVLILSLLQLVAFWKILGRMGYPPWFAIMATRVAGRPTQNSDNVASPRNRTPPCSAEE